MLDSGTAAVIAGASAIGGGAIVAASNYAINRAQARDAGKAELRRALIELYEMLQRIDHRLRVEPRPGPTARVVAGRMPLLGFAMGRTVRRLIDPQMDHLIAGVTRALSNATVIAPPELLPAIGRLTELMGAANEPDAEWWKAWDAARTDYFLKCREAVGSGMSQGTANPPGANRRPDAAAH